MVDFVDAKWHAASPNTDSAIMMGLAHTLVSEDLHDKEFLKTYCVGFEQFNSYLLGEKDGIPKDAEWAGEVSGVDPQVIRELAIQSFWMGAVLAAILGQVGLPGGGVGYGYGAINAVGRIHNPVPKPTLPRGSNNITDFIPVARIADLLLNPGGEYDYNGERRIYPEIKIVYWCGGNPFHHHQDLNRLVKPGRNPKL